MWHNDTLIDAWFVLTYKKTMLFWITVYWMLLFVNVSPELHRLVCVSVSLFSCPTLYKYYVLCMISLTLTLLPRCHNLFFLYFTRLLYTIMYACILCTLLAPLLLLSIFWIIMYFHVPYWFITIIALTSVTLVFIFWNVTLMNCIVILTCSVHFIVALDLDLYWWYLWFKYYVWPLTLDWW